jgi:hypothetical protein
MLTILKQGKTNNTILLNRSNNFCFTTAYNYFLREESSGGSIWRRALVDHARKVLRLVYSISSMWLFPSIHVLF